MNILVINTGSTSVKLAVVEHLPGTARVLDSEHYRDDGREADDLLREFLERSASHEAVVHRVVHGGDSMVDSRRIDPEVEAEIERLCELAPLHNPAALRWIRAGRRHSTAPQIAAFDTAFFAAMPEAARLYAIPPRLAQERGIRRYGFHGIAHRAMWRRWCELRPDLPDGGRLITLQLGGGCSLAAIRNGSPEDNSMGFSPAEGLVMATRSGDIDAGAVVHLIKHAGMSPDAVEALVNEESGLLGLSGRSADMRDLIDAGDEGARLALGLYVYRLRQYVGAYLAVLSGADGIVFGGGVGEHAPQIRARTLADMQWCGIELDAEANRAASGAEARISGDDSRIDVRVIPVDETSILAEEAYRVLTG